MRKGEGRRKIINVLMYIDIHIHDIMNTTIAIAG